MMRPPPPAAVRRPLAKRLLLLVASTLGALLLAEGVARRWLAPDIHWFRPVFRPEPDVGYTLLPGDHGEVLGAPLRVNRLGFRGRDWSAKRPGVLRVAVLGDSHAFGYGVAEPAALPSVLERELAAQTGRAIEALNFAVPGYTARQLLAVLEAKALALGPDAAVVVLCDNDAWPDLWVDAEGWLRGDPPQAPAGPIARVHGPFLPSWRLRWLRWSRLVGWLKLQVVRARMLEATAAPGWDAPVAADAFSERLRREVYEPVRRAVALCRSRGIAVAVALFGPDLEYRSLLATLGRDLSVPAVDLVTVFPEARSWNDLVLRFGLGWDPHLGEEGHARWGRALAHALAAELSRRR
jgi:lysophospholipase L1-like esterase